MSGTGPDGGGLGKPDAGFQDAFETHFPVLFMQRRHTGLEPLNRELAGLVRELERTRKSWEPNNKHQYRAGFSSALDFLDLPHPAIPAARQLTVDAVGAYMRHLQGVGLLDMGRHTLDDYRMELFGWCVLLRQSEWICPHIHKGAAFSGVYYIEVPKLEYPEGCLEFISPQGFYSSVPGRALAETTRLMPEEGVMLLFPAGYMHLVYPFHGAGDRICFSFNVQFEIAEEE